jgi:DNA-binding NarL/FixJ family response regulator
VTADGQSVGVLADDLIWSTRLVALVEGGGGVPRRMRRTSELETALADGLELVIVDLTALAYDGIDAVRLAAESGARVLAVGQHDDADVRRRALAAGAERVVPYRTLSDRGAATVEAWLATPVRSEVEP